MKDIDKGPVLVSACLLGIKCKYNGGDNKNEAVLNFLEGRDFIKVCPESMGGLESPSSFLSLFIFSKKNARRKPTPVVVYPFVRR